MHELSIAGELLSQVDELCRTHGANDVARVVVKIGCFSGVDPEALRVAFNALCCDRAWHHTVLTTEETTASLRCRSCGTTSTTRSATTPCPACNSTDFDLHGGQELILQQVELCLV